MALGANGIKEFARKHKVKSKVGEEIKSRLPTFRRYRLCLSLAGSRKKKGASYITMKSVFQDLYIKEKFTE